MSRTLLDHSVPRGIAPLLVGHDVKHAFELGWHELQNGALLRAAEEDGFEVLITADKNLRYQNKLSDRRIAVVEVSTDHWPTLERHAGLILQALDDADAGAYREVILPRPDRLRRAPRAPGRR